MSGRVEALIGREWEEARKNTAITLISGIMAVIFAALPALLILPMKMKLDPTMPLPDKVIREALGQFLTFFFLLPVIVPSTIASYSIIGEKQSRSLESLLATPIRTSELLIGKSLAYLIPSVVLTWLSYGVALVCIYFIDGPGFVPVLWQPGVIAAMLLLMPAIAGASMLLLILLSARSRDPREAQQWAVLIVVPIMGLGIGVGFGKIPYTVLPMVLAAAAVAAVDAAVLRLVVALFQREQILTRWK